jgi:TPR repeat protein
VNDRIEEALKASLVGGGRSPKSAGVALLEKAAGQEQVYAMMELRRLHKERKEHEEAVAWERKAAEAGLPDAMFALGWSLQRGEGVAAPDCVAAMDWYTRAADAGHGGAVQVGWQ